MDLKNDRRIVLTLDAGGTNFRFSAIRGGEAVTETIAMPSNGDNLDQCLTNIVDGFAFLCQLSELSFFLDVPRSSFRHPCCLFTSALL